MMDTRLRAEGMAGNVFLAFEIAANEAIDYVRHWLIKYQNSTIDNCCL